MFSRTVTYNNFNEVEVQEDLYFNMLVPEFADLEFNPTFEGSLSDYIKTAMENGDGQKVYTFFKLMIVNSYGRRTADGSEFHKKAEWTEKFLNSRAYEEFFLWLVGDPKNAEKFWHGIVPQKLIDKVEELEANSSKKKLKDLSREELLALWQKTEKERASIEA